MFTKGCEFESHQILCNGTPPHFYIMFDLLESLALAQQTSEHIGTNTDTIGRRQSVDQPSKYQ